MLFVNGNNVYKSTSSPVREISPGRLSFKLLYIIMHICRGRGWLRVNLVFRNSVKKLVEVIFNIFKYMNIGVLVHLRAIPALKLLKIYF